jgi:hypothetical protein
MRRYMPGNLITFIPNDVFSGLGSVTEMLALLELATQCIRALFECHAQELVLEPNHIYFGRSLQGTWQLDHIVCCLSLQRNAILFDSSIMHRGLFGNKIASISNGAFAGVDNLTSLSVFLSSLHSQLSSFGRPAQVLIRQLSYGDFSRRLH